MNTQWTNRAGKWGLALLAALAAGGCAYAPVDDGGYYYGDDTVIVTPPPRVEYRGYPPAPDYIWIDGYWSWSGHRHDWVPGRWAPPRTYIHRPPQRYYDRDDDRRRAWERQREHERDLARQREWDRQRIERERLERQYRERAEREAAAREYRERAARERDRRAPALNEGRQPPAWRERRDGGPIAVPPRERKAEPIRRPETRDRPPERPEALRDIDRMRREVDRR